jgi:hypothetical protein
MNEYRMILLLLCVHIAGLDFILIMFVSCPAIISSWRVEPLEHGGRGFEYSLGH